MKTIVSAARVAGSFNPMSEMGSTSDASRGFFIVFEGGDGCGKSTQAALLAERIDARLTREPGGTGSGAKIRQIVLDPDHPELGDRTEALLMAADRAQHVAELIRPTLAAGRHVVSDRFVASSLAYQGVGRGLGVPEVQAINDFATGGLTPDLVILVEVDTAIASERMGDDLDRIEAAGSDLANSVRRTYRDLAAQTPELWVTVDGVGTPSEVARRVEEAISARLGPELFPNGDGGSDE